MDILKYILLGLCAGFASAAFGIGGGVIFMPVLIIIFNYDITTAAGTSLAAIAPAALTGIITHYIINSGNIKLTFAAVIVIGSIIGSRCGAFICSRVHNRILNMLFAVLLIFTGLKLTGIIHISTEAVTSYASPVYLILLGLLAGLCSALFGIGGGIVLVPGLCMFFGLSIHQAIGTSLTVIFPTTIAGAFFHRKYNKINTDALKILIPASLCGAIGGAMASNNLNGEILKLSFGILLLAVSIKLFFEK